jgi:hypothetical protein
LYTTEVQEIVAMSFQCIEIDYLHKRGLVEMPMHCSESWGNSLGKRHNRFFDGYPEERCETQHYNIPRLRTSIAFDPI